jgi:hypothetical protein
MASQKEDGARKRCNRAGNVRCLVYIDELNIERDSRREEKRRARKGAERVVRG